MCAYPELDVVAHERLRLADLGPQRSAAFSPNLYRWMRAHGAFRRAGGVVQTAYLPRPGSRAEAEFGCGTLFLGKPFDAVGGNPDFCGARMIAVLCDGAREHNWCFSGLMPDLAPVAGFWERYLQVGRCAIDPEHQQYFLGGDRYRVEGRSRTCLWCGAHHERITRSRIIVDDTWI